MKREKKETGQLEFHEENLDPRGGEAGKGS
jgi:hypothetical protein